MKNSLMDLDLNLLKVLKAIVETKNTHKAAQLLGVSQPSVSRSLAKLRETFGDQLFIRKAHGVEPSELAEKLAEAADEMWTPITRVMESYNNFDPMEFTGQVVIAVNSSLLASFGVGIYNAVTEALPKARLRIHSFGPATKLSMLNGQVDYALQFGTTPLPQEIYTHDLKEIPICIVARKDHPVLSQGTELERIHQVPLVKMASEDTSVKRYPVEELYSRYGYTARIELDTHDMSILLEKLKHSDALTYSSSFLTLNQPELQAYPLSKATPGIRSVFLQGNYLQTRRGYPLNQLLHQVFQTYFDSVTQPAV